MVERTSERTPEDSLLAGLGTLAPSARLEAPAGDESSKLQPTSPESSFNGLQYVHRDGRVVPTGLTPLHSCTLCIIPATMMPHLRGKERGTAVTASGDGPEPDALEAAAAAPHLAHLVARDERPGHGGRPWMRKQRWEPGHHQYQAPAQGSKQYV